MNRQEKRTQIIIHIILSLLAALFLLPFLLVVSISVSTETDILYNGYKLIPEHFSLAAYEYIFRNAGVIIQAYQTTALFSIISMVLSVLLMTLLAYPLSQKAFKGRKFINLMVYFTMLFSGGLVPVYILNTQYLHLGNTIWIYILPSLISPWYVFLMRTFFQQIPEEIHESAVVDGANEFLFVFRMVLPLSKPVLATVALFTFLGKWNEWFVSMLYIDNQKLVSLQYLLQRMMNNVKLLQDSARSGMGSVFVDSSKIPTETIRMAMAVVVAGPALLVFPFFQKYFVKGLTVGSVKG